MHGDLQEKVTVGIKENEQGSGLDATSFFYQNPKKGR